MNTIRKLIALGSVLTCAAVVAGCEAPVPTSVQNGYRGVGMGTVVNPRSLPDKIAANQVPPASPAAPADGGPTAGATYKNVQVLGDLSVGEFTRLMVAITAWVSPKEGCAYCHKAGEDFSVDSLYTKTVSRKMLVMNKAINAEWTGHVGKTGVTCYTCHRGNNIPVNYWTKEVSTAPGRASMHNYDGQNKPAKAVALASLPYDIFSPYFAGSEANDIRVIGNTALPTGNRHSTKQAEYTYGLMVHMSDSLGVNCTYCHNSRSFGSWETSPPQRATAWYGIRMLRDVNSKHMDPLTDVFPAHRKGPLGDVFKVNCTTCHQGAYKPLYGANMLKDYGELNKVGYKTAAAAAPAAAAASDAAATVAAAVPAAMPATAAKPGAVLGRILFATGKADINDAGKKEVAAAVKILSDSPNANVNLSGFADQRGNAAANAELSKRRAQAVRDALKAAGIAEGRINMTKPEVAVGGTSDESRRVDIVVKP
jgi:photosynthetic reaction center cytochrome c subunit